MATMAARPDRGFDRVNHDSGSALLHSMVIGGVG
jgi:hypothetical protein